ncbi:hypothetical protein [Marinobacter sp. ELB17]|uniref:hypothetical protein n=1 Tax=Marinobacter sp. ELB17 TaxID=270374 RepID=UPI0000F3A172|nr:hypothetical protein [Marinobacter sp. ELB17]EAZ98052.1 hypothetical protein MELB17_08776 [Marinobacter sp. ELB17]
MGQNIIGRQCKYRGRASAPLVLMLAAALAALLSGCEQSADIGLAGQSANPEPETLDVNQPQVDGGGVSDISLVLKPAQLDWIGQQIFHNECAGQFRCLVHWNDGEAFPSLGIGHFIWYPKDVEAGFVESFPTLIDYMAQRQRSIPDWLRELKPFDAPWADQAAFDAVENSPQLAELREFLAGTQGVQAEFIFRRAQASIKTVVDAAPLAGQLAVSNHLAQLSQTPGGVYALVDYVNFKGEGLAVSERYQGEGWGLLQVLQAMPEQSADPVLQQFREAADKVLTRRADLATQAREREQWLPGWRKRLNTYREPDVMALPES